MGTLVGTGVAVFIALLAISGAINRELLWTGSRPPLSRTMPARSRVTDSAHVFAEVDAFVRAEAVAVRAPGVALAIVHQRAIVHRFSLGAADATSHRVHANTPFILGSLSKSITAVAVLQQVDAGQLGLDEPVRRYLPWFRTRDSTASREITVRQLLNHTSGIPKSAGLQLTRAAAAATRAEEARLLRDVRLHHAPGATFEYSNANYWLLGLLIEAVSRSSYESYVQSHIFNPLGMSHSFTSAERAREHGLADGHRIWFGYPVAEQLPYYWREMAVGYLISSSDDMARFLMAQLGVDTAGTAAVISPRARRLLHTPANGSAYAMGWLTDSVAGSAVLWHTGAVANYHGDMLLVPASGWGVVMLWDVNNFLLERQLGGTLRGVASLLLGYQPAPSPRLRFRGLYAGICLLLAIWLLWRGHQMSALWRISRKSMLERALDRGPPVGPSSFIDAGVSIGLLAGIPSLFGSPLSTLAWFVPDLTYWLVANAAIAMIIAVMRLLCWRRVEGEHDGVSGPQSASRRKSDSASSGARARSV